MAMTNVFTGASGTLLIGTAGGTPETDDGQAIGNLYDLLEVGRVTNVEVYVQTDLEEFHEIGRRHPTSLHYGNIHIGGKIDRAYINGALLWLLLGRGASSTAIPEPYVQPSFFMNVVLADPAVPNNRAILNLQGVKFQNWSYRLPEDDVVMENVIFKALRLDIQDEEGGTVKAPQFPAASTT
jgi:hypothetical protein